MPAAKATLATGFLRRLKKDREAFLDRHADARDWFGRMFSAATCSLYAASRGVMRRHCRGLVLDAGAGRGGWRGTILETASGYESIDMGARGGHVPTWTGDLADMPEVAGGRYDSVVCHQVLEHVPRPWDALAELRRVLKPGGHVILSVPHLSRRHELPHDYFRFTQEGLARLFEDAGFEVVEIAAHGGVLSFLHHQTSFLFPGVLTAVPWLGEAAVALNAPLSWLLAKLDDVIDSAHLIPLGVVVAARKPLAA